MRSVALGHVRGFEVFVKFWFQIAKQKKDPYPPDKVQRNDYIKTPGVLPQNCIFYVGEVETEKRKNKKKKTKMEKAKEPYQTSVL